jgi:hypothetical protein
MTVDDWLELARADARRRGLEELDPLLETLARATVALRAAPWNRDARTEWADESEGLDEAAS